MSKPKALLNQMEIFDVISQKGLSPNQYYLLCCMRDSIQPTHINLHLEIRQLKHDGWITEVGERKFRLAPEAISLIDRNERFFKIQKKKTSSQLMTRDYKEKLEQYREIFPNIKLPSGKAARCAVSNLENAFRWFFENHDYEWDTIMKATAVYVNEYEVKGWKFMRTSQYFVRKQEPDRTFASDLANYCAIVESGGDVDDKPSFSTKVV